MAKSSSKESKSDVSRYPTSNDFDQKTAKRLLSECSTLIIEEIPVGTQFGIDLNIYNIGDKFLGVKMIGSGLHLIHYSSVSRDGSVGPRTAFFKYFKDKELVVKKWNKFNEDIDEEYNDLQQLQRLKDSLIDGSIDRYLGAYQFDTYNGWVGLTDYITESLLNRLNPKCGKIKSVTELIPLSFNSFNKEIKKDSEGLPVMEAEPNSVINFTSVPNRFLYPLNSNPSEISYHSIDASFTLETILSKYEQSSDILGELQFAFVCFLIGHVYDAFEHWKSLLKIVCMSENAIAKYTDLYLNFVRVLYFQLKQTPHDFFADIVENDNFLVIYLRRFFSNIKSNPNINETLRKRGQRFQENVTNKFKWDFSDEPEDEAPTVVSD